MDRGFLATCGPNAYLPVVGDQRAVRILRALVSVHPQSEVPAAVTIHAQLVTPSDYVNRLLKHFPSS
ncbi:MAG: hypothetical protein H0U53_00125 [Actinobacteria bacterium]|nr:hypothetical protein [Actinomycetota bacterium]